jgi:hypothetical protein
MYKNIINPKTNKNIRVNSVLGKKILNKYVQNAGWFNHKWLRKELEETGNYRFGIEIETCMNNGFNCDNGDDHATKHIFYEYGRNWSVHENHELVPTHDTSLKCDTQTPKEFIMDGRAEYLWNAVDNGNGYTNISDKNYYGSIDGYDHIDTVLGNVLETFWASGHGGAANILKATPCATYGRNAWRVGDEDISSCSFHVHMSDPNILGTSLKGRLMLVELATIFRGIDSIHETATFGENISTTFPFMEFPSPLHTPFNDTRSIQELLICSGLSRGSYCPGGSVVNYLSYFNKESALEKELPYITDNDYSDTLISILKSTPDSQGRYCMNQPDYLIQALQPLDVEKTRYWLLNCGQSTEYGKSWLDSHDGIHVEFRGHDDFFKVLTDRYGDVNQNNSRKWLKKYLKYLIQIFNAAKNRMLLIMHIYKNLVSADDEEGEIDWTAFSIDIYISLLKAGVVNLEIFRQKLHSPNGYRNALGGDFLHGDNEYADIDLEQAFDYTNYTRSSRSLAGLEQSSILQNNDIVFNSITSTTTLSLLLDAIPNDTDWVYKNIQYFHEALEYTGHSLMYGYYKGDITNGPDAKNLFRMFSLPNPNTVRNPYFNHQLDSPGISSEYLGYINNQLIYLILYEVSLQIPVSPTWIDVVMNLLITSKITTIYKLIYIFQKNKDPIDYIYMDNLTGYSSTTVYEYLTELSITTIQAILDTLGISSDCHAWY